VSELEQRFKGGTKGEITLVFGGVEAEPDMGAAEKAVAELLESGVSRRRAAEIVAGLTGVARNRLYKASL
jgi:16S rRNA C1402 (ribose-2'-O) methylase RsmI